MNTPIIRHLRRLFLAAWICLPAVAAVAQSDYNPTLPPDPAMPDTTHYFRLTIKVEPEGSGYTQPTDATLTQGQGITVQAQSHSNFRFSHWTNADGQTIGKDPLLNYVMPAADATITARFVYDPGTPPNPGANAWIPAQGLVIADDFVPGNLLGYIDAALNGADRSEVEGIIVSGRMTDGDFGIANYFTSLALLDLSRVSGVTKVPSYAFDGKGLQQLWLPSCIETIGYRAFNDCGLLSSLTVYALTPPSVEAEAFRNVNENLVVYVPASALEAYQSDAFWSNFTLMPIADNLKQLMVSLPAGTDMQLYKGLWLEMVNVTSGVRQHIVITDKTNYTFPSVISQTRWSLAVRNERGDVFGRIDNVVVDNSDVSVTFASLLPPCRVQLRVFTPTDGANVTAKCRMMWTRENGEWLSEQPIVEQLPQGINLNYALTLPESMAFKYATPKAGNHTTNGQDTIDVWLTPLLDKELTVCLRDSSSRLSLAGANITAIQKAGGTTQTVIATTDAKGNAMLSLKELPTQLMATANDYVSGKAEIAADSLVSDTCLWLKKIAGATIGISLRYAKSVEEGLTRDTLNYYDNYADVAFAARNVTKGKAVEGLIAQYPQIVIPTGATAGDSIEITATSVEGKFMPTTAGCRLNDNLQAKATFTITQLGGLNSQYATTECAAVKAVLYDATGNLVSSTDFALAAAAFTNLPDGYYKLVAIGKSDMLGRGLSHYEALAEAGLTEGKDFVVAETFVESGTVSRIDFASVPLLDQSKLAYTDEGATFTVNKPDITVGNYLTFSSRVSFRPQYASANNVSLVVDLPEGCTIVEQSAMEGTKLTSYSLDGQRLTIPVMQTGDRIRFCVIPTKGGNHTATAYASFSLDDQQILQPFASASFNAEALAIEVPKLTASEKFTVTGQCKGQSDVTVYVDGTPAGATTATAGGRWTAKCKLIAPANLSTHIVYAEATVPNGETLETVRREMTYDKDAITVSKVTMYHYNPEQHTTYQSVFDFLNPRTEANTWIVYYPNKKFTYTVEFTNNSPEVIAGVTLYIHTADGQKVPLYPSYDAEKDLWVASIDMGNKSDGYYPVNVSVDFDTRQVPKLDYDNYQQLTDGYTELGTELQEAHDQVDNYFEQINSIASAEQPNQEVLIKVIDELMDYCGVTQHNETSDDSYGYDGYIEEFGGLWADEILEESKKPANEVISGPGITNGPSLGRTPEELTAEGYKPQPTTSTNGDGNIYYNVGYDKFELEDPIYNGTTSSSGRHTTVDLSLAGMPEIDESNGWQTLGEVSDLLYSKMNMLTGLIEGCEDAINLRNEAISKEMYRLRLDIKLGIGNIWLKLQQLNKLSKEKATYNTLQKHLTKTHKIFFAIADLVITSKEAIEHIDLCNKLYSSIPTICEDDQARADKYRTDLIWLVTESFLYHIGSVALTGVQMGLATGSLIAAASGVGAGVGLVGAIGSICLAGAQVGAAVAYDWAFKTRMNQLYWDIRSLKCMAHCGLPNNPSCPAYPFDDNTSLRSTNPDDKVQIDPSGFVYEAVETNRLQGVKATAFYKEQVEDIYGDLHDEVTLWNAEEYAQRNPLFTDENGMYAWDVPQGLWQVKFEKEGYETAYSEWLPVPPPQLEVNIGMRQNRQPVVASVHAYEDAVSLMFDKYMNAATLTTDNIRVQLPNGTIVAGRISLQKEGDYAQKVRFTANEPFNADSLTLVVVNRVESYAGVRMADDYQQTFTIEPELNAIEADSIVVVPWHGAATLRVRVVPALAAKGKTLKAYIAGEGIAKLENAKTQIADNGNAELVVMGNLPGEAPLTLSIEEADVSATVVVSVLGTKNVEVAMPTASIPSGTSVPSGTKVHLSCATEGAVIYYTLDGTCPCDERGTRQLYNDVQPIVITGPVTIKAYAVLDEIYESDVAEFVYGELNAIHNAKTDVQFWPQPVDEVLHIALPSGQLKHVEVTDAAGTAVIAADCSGSKADIDFRKLQSGCYIVRVASTKGTMVHKAVKR